jgi:NAD(P)-dependent dehydrogenase (short-subunit alcohol dehydrogenase family)
MTVNQKVVVVTGGGSGIGRALCKRFAAEGARSVAVVDIDRAAAESVAREIGGLAISGADVSDEATVGRVVAEVLHHRGRIDLFCSNAGIAVDGGEETPTAEWDRCWGVNVMAHVYAARAVLPHMLARGDGYLLQTVSAAGLLTHIQSATYAATKHASLAFAEWLSIAYGDRGIKVSALCPQGVRTNMLRRAAAGGRTFLLDTAIEPEQVADDVIKGIAEERFLILPHPDVAEYFRRKAADYDRWLRGMRKLRAANP